MTVAGFDRGGLLACGEDVHDDVAVGDHALELVVGAAAGSEPTFSSAIFFAASSTVSSAPIHVASAVMLSRALVMPYPFVLVRRDAHRPPRADRPRDLWLPLAPDR